ncbi:hypothetical protein ALC60_11542 [Trachymyrmex zeteki]|uniref:Uncharacterized protein n=1 Tax=Mycetomoellerius zeteki TaxID=64791 RepID=A0A151WNJ6_9HYME|nr:hypothetical protein ALC60_11542 [Trachymyrmex zeteki]
MVFDSEYEDETKPGHASLAKCTIGVVLDSRYANLSCEPVAVQYAHVLEYSKLMGKLYFISSASAGHEY